MVEERRFVSSPWLATVLRGDQQPSTDQSKLSVIVDLRHPNDFQRRHIAGSVNLVLPTLLHKRLQRGTVAATSLLMDAVHSGDTVVLVDGGDSSISSLIYKRLQEENCHSSGDGVGGDGGVAVGSGKRLSNKNHQQCLAGIASQPAEHRGPAVLLETFDA
ncbi:hypothetical protein T08_13016 [Trichinella sp. T8]|nr:hypothetical protein T08_13016 [Trichinella sp. T8]